MARCDQGYLCDVCGDEVENIRESDLYLRFDAFEERLVFSMLPQPEACHELVICTATPGYVGKQKPPHGPLEPASC